LLLDVLEKERRSLEEDVIDKICEISGGSARKALMLLQSVISLEGGEEEKLKILSKEEEGEEAIEIARILLKKGTWKDLCYIVNKLKLNDEQVEGVRRLILSYMAKVALGGNPERACKIIDCFCRNFYDSGLAGFILACYECLYLID